MKEVQQILSILLQGEMELVMERIMSFELYGESVRIYRDKTGWVVAHAQPDQLPELYNYIVAGEALDQFDMIAGFIRLGVDKNSQMDQKNT